MGDTHRAARLVMWRHPRVPAAAGRCVGQIDLPVDLRRARRLARTVHNWAQQERWPAVQREVWTSPLHRAWAVGRALQALGWRHRVAPALSELDFGRWEGRDWDDIGEAAVQAWCDDLACHAPGGGESVTQLFERVKEFLRARTMEAPGPQAGTSAPICLIGHAGWMQAAQHVQRGALPPCTAMGWGPAPRHGQRLVLSRAQPSWL